MESATHRLPDLFRQLGLPASNADIEHFIATHRPLPPGTAVADAAFWTPSQAQLLRESLCVDADWAGVVDQLGEQLSR